MDLSFRCRMCGGIVDQFCESFLETSHRQLLWAIHHFDITFDDGLPTRVCILCFASIRDHCMFLHRSDQANSLFAGILDNTQYCSELYHANEACDQSDSPAISSPVHSADEESSDDTSPSPVDLKIKFKLRDFSVLIVKLSEEKIKTLQCKEKKKPSSGRLQGGEMTAGPSNEQLHHISQGEHDYASGGAKTRSQNTRKPEANSSHTNLKRLSRSSSIKNETLVCVECGASFSSELSRNLHFGLKHKDITQQFKCSQCHLVFAKKYELNKHFHKHREYLNCTLCQYKTQNRESFKLHIARKHQNNSYYCKTCNISFSSNDILQRHVKYVHRNFICNFCTLSFKTKSDLTKHVNYVHCMDIHKKYSCDQCPMSYTSSRSLRVHKLYIHSDERPFKCGQCNFSFKTKSSLNKHDLVHSDVRAFKCHKCRSQFKEKSNLVKHLTFIHSNNLRLYKCNICQKSFQTNRILQNHCKIHSSSMCALHCTTCGYKFTKRSSLLRHVKEVDCSKICI